MHAKWNRHKYVNLNKHMYCYVTYFIHLAICLTGDYMIIHEFQPHSFSNFKIFHDREKPWIFLNYFLTLGPLVGITFFPFER